MALIRWDDEEENKDDLLGFTPIKQVASVQSGAWQPAPSGADSPQMLGEDDDQQKPGIFDQTQNQQENYLLSDEKAQVDAEKVQRDAEIAEARRQDAARQAAAAEMNRQAEEEEPEFDLAAAEKDTGWKKYYDKEFKREKDSLDFWGRLMDGGQSSKRAEVNARIKYNNELLTQAYDDDGNVLDPVAAAKAKVLARYNSGVAQQNSERSRALGNAIGAFDKPGQDGGFWGRVKNAINAEKQMSIYDAIFGADDTTKFSVNDVGRFGGGLVQGIATMPVIGGKEITESVRGRGTNYETGLEEDLNGMERGGRLVSGGLNVVTPFVGGSGKLLDSLTSKVLKDTATAAEKTLLKKLTSQVLMPSLEQGAIGATQAGAEYFGNGNTLVDENGEFDKEKLLQFAKETGTAGAMGVAGGAVLSGGAMGVTRLRNRGDVTPNATPEITNLPDDVTPVDGAVNTETGVPLTRQQVAERLMPKLADNKDIKQQIADAAGMSKDVESPIRDILKEGNVKPRQAERVATRFEKLEKQLQEYNRLEEMNQKAYAEGGAEALDPQVSKDRSRAAREMGTTTRRLMQDIRRMEGSRDFKIRLINNLTDAIGTRNASVLSSAGLLERNMMQELTANLKLAAKNPVQMARSTFQNGNIVKDTIKSELSHWGDMPAWNKPVEIVKYVVGNTYRTGMIPTTALANTRRGAVRDEFTKWAFQELEGRKVSTKEAHKLAGTAGNELEALVNTFVGVDNGMTNRKQAMDAMKAWKEYIRTGDDGAKADFMAKVEQHNSLADQMISGLAKEGQARARGLMAMKNLIFPFVRTATNLAKNTVRQDLNPFARSLLDEIRVDQRSGGANTINLIKSKLVDYGIMGGAAALASSGAIVYNDGDEVDKPKGWSLDLGDGNYVPVRATSLELPIAMAGTAQAMASDIAQGKARDWKYYAGMVTGSLPYIDQFNTTTGAVDSLMSGEDAGYAAKSYAVNTAKSFVPFSNNGIQPYLAGKSGESLNAKSVYDDNLMTWFTNTVRKSYDPEFYNSLKDSRDNAGRVRTVDNQGVISNKTINDAGTAEFNDRITDLVNYGRENGLGDKVQDMFNTYDTGKNNNFKSIQDAITFLDVEDGGSPDNAKKLEKNGKLTDLAQQMRDGFFGDSGSELLTLDGQNLKSDASVPNGAGSKNSKLPMSMQSIKNAVAQTDLPKEDSDKLYEISNQSTELYNQLKAKSISYDQYSAAKAKLGQQEIDILSNSESYQKMEALFDELDESGFFDADGLGSTKSGQTYLWNSLNALLGSKGATPAANYPDSGKGFTPWGRGGTGRTGASGVKGEGIEGLRWSPVGKRQMASVQSGRYTPVNVKVKLGNAVKKDRSQNYSDRTI